MMGLSVGWGDQYSASTNFQWIDITGLPNGRYRLTATADPSHLVSEISPHQQRAVGEDPYHRPSVTVLSTAPARNEAARGDAVVVSGDAQSLF